MRYLKCGHPSVSDDKPICLICPVPNWDGIEPDYTLPQCQFREEPIPVKGFRCRVCGAIYEEPITLSEITDEQYHSHYDLCRDRKYARAMQLLLL